MVLPEASYTTCLVLLSISVCMFMHRKDNQSFLLTILFFNKLLCFTIELSKDDFSVPVGIVTWHILVYTLSLVSIRSTIIGSSKRIKNFCEALDG